MQTLLRVVGSGLAAILVASCGTEPPVVHENESAIIGGTRDTGDPSVVLLINYPAGETGTNFGTCTAELISPTVLLTAAHCVQSSGWPCNGGACQWSAFLDDDVQKYNSNGGTITVAELKPVLQPIASVHDHPSYNGSANDIAVAILQSPLSSTPIPYNATMLTSAIVGQPARIVGYGQTMYQTWNATKYHATTRVDRLDGTDWVVVGDSSKRTCLGDSGGPALVMMNGRETIIGVVSYGPQGCTGASHFSRTDRYASFIEQYVPPPSSGDDAGVSEDPPGGGLDAGVPDGDAGHPLDDPDGASGGCVATPPSGGTLLLLGLLALRRRARRLARSSIAGTAATTNPGASGTSALPTRPGAAPPRG